MSSKEKTRPDSVGKTAKRLLLYVTREYKWKFILVVVFIIISALSGVAGSVFIRFLIDDYITPLLTVENPVFTELIKALVIMASIYLVGVLSTFIYNRLMVSISQGILKKIRDEMFEHMQSLPINYFDTRTHGNIMSYYTNDTDTLREMISISIPEVLSSLIYIVSVFCAMLATSIYLTGIVIVMMLIIALITKYMGPKSSSYFVKQQKSLGEINGYIEEMIDGQKVIKVFSHEQKTIEGFNKINDELTDNSVKANSYTRLFLPIMINLGYLQHTLIAFFGAIFALNGIGNHTLGSIISFIQLSQSYSQPITQVSQQISSIVTALAGAERIFKLLDERPERDRGYVTLVNAKYNEKDELVETDERTGMWAWKHPHQTGEVTYTKLNGKITFENVDFGYVKDKLVLKNINLYAKPGQKIALVGATGAGKTTITNLINNFYNLQRGKIRYDEINIKKIKLNDLRRSLGMVLQDTNLFTGTVMENIKYGKLNATDEEVIEAAKLANAHEFIKRLPDGYNTVLEGNAANLSQGQRQLLSIARAALIDPPVMILDEATSSIDTRTEKLVQDGMDKLMKGRTVFVIAHRLSTIKNSNLIVVLDHGEIIEKGDHDELIQEKGIYYQLYTGAFELE